MSYQSTRDGYHILGPDWLLFHHIAARAARFVVDKAYNHDMLVA